MSTGEKKFICPDCDKKFMRSDHLTKHQRTHRKLASVGVVLDSSDLDCGGCLDDSRGNVKDERFTTAQSVLVMDDFSPLVDSPGITK